MNSAAVECLKDYGFSEIPHANGKNLLSHSIAVSQILSDWGLGEEIVLAGLFHSCYGRSVTQFKAIDLNKRPEIQKTIGTNAEKIAYLSCALTEESLWSNLNCDNSKYAIYDRFSKVNQAISQEDFINLITISLANMFDHISSVKNVAFKWPTLSLFIQVANLLPLKPRTDLLERFQI